MSELASESKLHTRKVQCNGCRLEATYRTGCIGCVNIGEVIQQTGFEAVFSYAFMESTGWFCPTCAEKVGQMAIDLSKLIGLKEVRLSALMGLKQCQKPEITS